MRRLPPGLTTPGAIAAPASGALAAHQPMPPKNRPITRAPARDWSAQLVPERRGVGRRGEFRGPDGQASFDAARS